ncbi:MAG: TIGR03619 family F420-dependent LLM class oxidoreductase [Candidatus Caldarchaeum sp.]
MSRRVQFGVLLPDYCGGPVPQDFTTLGKLREFCRAVERLGFTSIWHREHFTSTPTSPSSYEPVATMSAVSQLAQNPRLGLITILPLRHPVILAKELATIDVLSAGRVSLCCAVGYREHEFEALGVSMADRGRRFVESVRIIKALWTGDNVSYEGDFYRFEDVSLHPKPVQKPHPPIVIGSAGRSVDNPRRFEKLLMRAVELGEGWYAAINMTPESIANAVAIIKSCLKKMKKDVDSYSLTAHKYVYLVEGDVQEARRTVSAVLSTSVEEAGKQHLVGSRDEIITKAEKLLATGVTHFNIAPLKFDHRAIEFFAHEVVPRYS